jgi:hypothetical protein
MYKFLLRKKIKKALTNSDRVKVYHSLKEVKDILILFDISDYDDVIHFVYKMRVMGKRVKTIGYKNDKDIKNYPKTTKIVTSKEMKSWKGDFLVSVSDFIKKEKFDLVIDFNLRQNLLLQYILVLINSPFKVGFQKSDFQLHDMIILPSSESNELSAIKELSRQLIYYLTTISSY